MGVKFQKPRGTQDILPSEQKYWYWTEDNFRSVMLSAGFGRIITPTFENTDLFVRSVGEDTDIVSKEMYTFTDRGGNSLTLRPEGTAGVVRAYIENGMHKEPQPVKVFYWGPVFRYDRPQAGRYREFCQPGLEMFGEQDPIVDAQVIALMMKFYRKIGLKDLVVKINSIGDIKGRAKMQKALVDFLSAHRRTLCAECKRRMIQNPMRVLDCKEKKCQPVIEEAGGVLIDNLNTASKEHFTKVLEYLDDMGVEYELDHRLVRGLDYYTHTVFEVVAKNGGLSIGGGGRYDELVKMLGGPATPAIGFGVGLDRTIDLLKKQNVAVPEVVFSDVFIVQLGDEAKKKAIRVIDQLDEAGYRVAHALGRSSIKSQLRVANRLGTKIAIIIGEREVHDKSVIIRDLSDSTQESVLDRDLIKMLKKRIQ
ncbi:histidine--tRNA ligase [candidate division Kazan bacterium]|uniref:Histidine--tRNA ligase n=1 Tax=candidate division Kazan bacterium TaxID=2202143 RepID=A0A420ZD70_UNCK3|nr:MAG: histidine--tRNA ligase [candidate division Kazan bacterium]